MQMRPTRSAQGWDTSFTQHASLSQGDATTVMKDELFSRRCAGLAHEHVYPVPGVIRNNHCLAISILQMARMSVHDD